MRLTKLVFFIVVTLATAAREASSARIEFRKGHSSIQLNDMLTAGQRKEYVIAGRSTQHLSMQLTADPNGSVAVMVVDEVEKALILDPVGNDVWSTLLTHDGDYRIRIVRRKSPSTVIRYQLGVKLR